MYSVYIWLYMLHLCNPTQWSLKLYIGLNQSGSYDFNVNDDSIEALPRLMSLAKTIARAGAK